MRNLEYPALKKCTAVIAVSDNVSEAARNHGVHAAVIRNGIDLEKYCPPRNPAETAEIRRRLEWPIESIIILHTGVLIDRKRPIEIIEGFLSAYVPERCTLVLAGDGPLKSRCIQAANHSKQIIFLGRRGDVADLLKAADVLVSNSESEGFPLALLEGCASGIQVLASDIPAHRKLQELFPEQCKLFEEGDKQSLAAALSSISGSRRMQLSPIEEGLSAISDRTMAEAYGTIYQRLLKGDSTDAT
jgi:glycosyltransferase involved in cell wall biosynthesis